MEVATLYYVNLARYTFEFQHLFFLMEVATRIAFYLSGIKALFQHLFFLMEVATDFAEKEKASAEVSTPFLPNGSRYFF